MHKLIAVITGGTRGIGLAIAESLAKRGASLAITYLNDDKMAESAKKQLEASSDNVHPILLLKGDAGDSAVVAEHCHIIRDTLGLVNVLVNNAGIMPTRNPAPTIKPRILKSRTLGNSIGINSPN